MTRRTAQASPDSTRSPPGSRGGLLRGSLGLYLVHLWMPLPMAAGLVAALQQPSPSWQLAPLGLAMLLLGVFVVYTGDRLLEHGSQLGRALAPLAGATLVACGLLAALALQRSDTLPTVPTLRTLLGLALISLGYPLLKRWPALKLASVTGAWTLSCARLPFLTDPTHLPPAWPLLGRPAVLSVACAIAAGTVLCDLKDRDSDARSGVRTLPVLLGVVGACVSAALLATLGAGFALWSHAPALLACNVAMLLLAAQPQITQKPVSGPLLVDAALAAPGLALWLVHALQRG